MKTIKPILAFLLFLPFSCSITDQLLDEETPRSLSKKGPPEIESIQPKVNSEEIDLVFDEPIYITDTDPSHFEVTIERADLSSSLLQNNHQEVSVLRVEVKDNRITLILSVKLIPGDLVTIVINEEVIVDTDQEPVVAREIEPITIETDGGSPEGENQPEVEEESVEEIQRKLAEVDTSFSKGRDRPLWYALNYYPNIKQKIDEALANGANINARWLDSYNEEGNTFLIYAHNKVGFFGDEPGRDVLSYIISKGANPNVPNLNGETILKFSAYSDSIDTFKFIYNLKGLYKKSLNNNGEDVLYASMAAHKYEWNNVDVKEKVEFLVSEGFSVNQKKDNGNSVLDDYIESAREDYFDYARVSADIDLLISLGVDVDKTTFDKTIQLISQNGFWYSLSQEGNDGGYELFSKIYDMVKSSLTSEELSLAMLATNNPDIVQKLLQDNPGVDLANKIGGEYPLMAVVKKTLSLINKPHAPNNNKGNFNWNNCYEIMQLYLENGADISVFDNNGNSILNFLPFDLQVLKKYLDLGAPINNQDGMAIALLKRAQISWRKDSVAMFKFLLENGAKGVADIEDFEERTLRIGNGLFMDVDFLEYFLTELVPTYSIPLTKDFYVKHTISDMFNFDDLISIWEKVIIKDLFIPVASRKGDLSTYKPEQVYRIVKALIDAGYNIEQKSSDSSPLLDSTRWFWTEYDDYNIPGKSLTPLELAAFQYHTYSDYFTHEDAEKEKDEFKRTFEYIKKKLEEKTGVTQKTLDEYKAVFAP